MKLTLLLDLDDTLLDTNMQNFIPAYFKALSDTLLDQVSPEIMIPALMNGTWMMMTKTDPERTLKEVFDEFFYAKIGVNSVALRSKIDSFYNEVFPKLEYLTKQRPDAIEFVNWAIGKNYRIVIATNPLFPLKAIHHRLRWAGLDPEVIPFSHITSYENSHFTKENDSYFPEILGKLGWVDEPVIMVGNDFKMDIEPAMRSGLPVYWIKYKEKQAKDCAEPPQGKIKDLQTWLEGIPIDSLYHSILKPSSLLAMLRSSPAVLEGKLINISEDDLDAHSDQQGWSIREVVCHLRDVEIEVNIPRIRKILTNDNPYITGEITDRWASERNYAAQNGKTALISFITARKETLSLLENLVIEWDRPARHSIFGSYTLHELVGVIAGHDKNHVKQIHNNLLVG